MADIIKLVEDINHVWRREIGQVKDELELRIQGVRDLMEQHDSLTKVANDKAQETLNERLAKMNEFREQQKDIISRFATITSLENLITRFEQNIKTVTERYETNIKVIGDKLEMLKSHNSEKVDLIKMTLDDKRDTQYTGILEMFKNIENKAEANLKTEIEKFIATDRQIQVLINTNAELSNRGIDVNSKRISELFEIKNKQEGSITVLKYILSGLITIVIALIIAFLTKLLIK